MPFEMTAPQSKTIDSKGRVLVIDDEVDIRTESQ
jgi:hypothetical protein